MQVLSTLLLFSKAGTSNPPYFMQGLSTLLPFSKAGTSNPPYFRQGLSTLLPFSILSCNIQYQKILLTIQLFLFYLVSSTLRRKTALGFRHSRGVPPERTFSGERRILAPYVFPPTYRRAVHSLQSFLPSR